MSFMNPIDCGIYPATFEGKQGFVVKTRHGTCIFQTNRGNWRDDKVSEKELTIIEEQDNRENQIKLDKIKNTLFTHESLRHLFFKRKS